jgi:peptidoglycan/xylan/chitin deacetylase (PgdA/CDA1 family)
VCLQFDDASESVYTGAYQYTKTKGVLATFNLISGNVGGGGQVTLAQAQEMYAGGWDIANHSDDSASLVGLTEGQVTTKLAACKTALDGWGMTRASMHHAYPGGAYDETVIAGAQAAGIVTGRGTVWATNSMFALPAIDTMRWPYTTTLGNSTSLADAKALVDRIATHGGGLSIVGHVLVEGAPSSSTEWNVDDYHALIDYIVAKRVYPITVSQMYSLLSGPTRILRPW